MRPESQNTLDNSECCRNANVHTIPHSCELYCYMLTTITNHDSYECLSREHIAVSAYGCDLSGETSAVTEKSGLGILTIVVHLTGLTGFSN